LLHDLADLEALWESIAEHSVQRQTWIEELDATLDQVENDRSNLVCKYFQLILLYKTVFTGNEFMCLSYQEEPSKTKTLILAKQ